MKKFILILLLIPVMTVVKGQPFFDLGLKGGATFSSLDFNNDLAYNSDKVLRYHIGAFSRIGWGRLFIQPEVYFNSRGGNLKSTSGLTNTAVANFDFTSVDVPLLAGVRLFKNKPYNIRFLGGPMLGFMTSRDVEPKPTFDELFSKTYFEDHLFGWQFGGGIDFSIFSLDVRWESSRNSVYQSDDFSTRNKVVLVSLGFKLF
jgi:hypothetical protein